MTNMSTDTSKLLAAFIRRRNTGAKRKLLASTIASTVALKSKASDFMNASMTASPFIGMESLENRSLLSVTVSGGTGGTNLSADFAKNGSAVYTTLTDIVNTEGASGDFGKADKQTLILTAPTGWTFDAASTPGLSVGAGGDLSKASAANSST